MSNGKWMLVDYDNHRSVVNIRAVVNGESARVGDVVTLTSRNAEKKQATLVMSADDRKFLEQQIPVPLPMKCEARPTEGTEEILAEPQLYEEVRDFSPSGSSWGPDGSRASSDSEPDVEEDEVGNEDHDSKRIKLEGHRQYKNSKKYQTPTLRPEPVVPNHLREKLKKLKQISVTKERRNSTRDQGGPSKKAKAVTVSSEELRKVNRDLAQFKDMLKSLKNAVNSIRMTLSADHLYETVYASGDVENKVEIEVMTKEVIEDYDVSNTNDMEMEKAPRPIQAIKPITYGELRRGVSQQNEIPVVTNNNNVAKTPKRQKKVCKVKEDGSGTSGSITSETAGEMIPIGSGKTYVPKSIYSQINWNSYTMATRKLLMAVFPRRTLATHSLTGKASPAFTNKPAKLSLDPKKVFDIVLTVTKKCNVKESLVRSAITTKCADENKMMRIQKEKMAKSTCCTPFKNNNQENAREDRRKTQN